MKRASPGLIGPAKKTKTAPEAKKTQPKMGTLFLLDWNFLWVPVETGNKIALGINPKFINWWRAIHSFLSGRQYQIGILITDEFKQERKLVKSINGGAAMYNYSCLLQSLVNELGDVFPELVVNSNGSVIFYSEYESLKLELIAEVFPGYHQENIVFITGTNFSGDIDKFSDEQKIVVTFSGEVDTHDFNSARQMISKEAGKIPQRGKTYLILDLDDSLLRRADSLLI
nr:hypothetical protein [Gammaproteobacteria bacterium]